MRAVLLCLAFVCGVSTVSAQKVTQVSWESAHTAPAVKISGPAGDWLPAFRLALSAMPESTIVEQSLRQPQMLGLSAKDAEKLERLTAERYAAMKNDPLFRRVPTALPYCYSETQPKEGLATVYVPKVVGPDTAAIVFLHGYGGSFLWCLDVLVEAFPGAVIVCPAYGMSAGSIPAAYVREAVVKSAEVAGVPLKQPVLMGLSAGGFGACKVYVESPGEWRRLVCLAAYAPDTVLTAFSPDMDIRFLAGAQEDFVSNGYFKRGVQQAMRNRATVDFALIPEVGHFFLLEKREESVRILREWMK